jgi:hypothetical protein
MKTNAIFVAAAPRPRHRHQAFRKFGERFEQGPSATIARMKADFLLEHATLHWCTRRQAVDPRTSHEQV